jgi:hypothetical protein
MKTRGRIQFHRVVVTRGEFILFFSISAGRLHIAIELSEVVFQKSAPSLFVMTRAWRIVGTPVSPDLDRFPGTVERDRLSCVASRGLCMFPSCPRIAALNTHQ